MPHPEGTPEDGEKGSALLLAAKVGDIDSVIKLCQDIGERARSVKDDSGQGALHYAAHFGHKNVAQYLLGEWKFDINSEDHQGCTPLVSASASKQEDMVSFLLEHGAHVYAAREGAISAIHQAAESGSIPILQTLIEKGADIHESSFFGTPLIWAAGVGHAAVLDYLLSQGALPDVINSQGMSALFMTVVMEQMARRERTRSPRASSVIECVKVLVRAGADVNFQAPGGFTPLHVAAEGGDVDLVHVLLEAGARLDIENHEGVTPLNIAAQWEQTEVVEKLLAWSGAAGQSAQDAINAAAEAARKRRAAAAAPQPAHKEGSKYIPVIPAPEDKPDRELAIGFKQKGNEFFKSGEFETAASLYTTALKHWTADSVIWSNRAAAHLKLNNPEAALRDAQMARALDEKSIKAWGREGSAAQALQRWEDAAHAFYVASQLDTSNDDWLHKCKHAVEQGRRALKK